jgi:hypothetical protein
MTQSFFSILTRTEVWLGLLALTAFLILSWALRGAPLGQAAAAEDEEEDAPGAGYRDRVTLAIVGGLLLVLAGGHLALTGRVLWSLPAFALGFAIVLTLIAVNRRYRHGSPSLRRTIELANSTLAVALVAGIVIVVNVFAFRFGGRALDLTREGTFTLSSLSVNQLKSLKRPVTFTVFFGDTPRSIRQRDRMQQLLDLYKGVNPERIAIVYLNPFTELERFEALLKRYPDIGVTQGGGLLIEHGEGSSADHVVIRNNDLFAIARNDRFDDQTPRFESSFKGEDAVTTALIRLQQGKRPKLALIVGHGEPRTAELDPRKAGLGVFKARLGAIGYEVIELNLLKETVPPEVALLAIVGPKAAFNADEVAKLKAAVDGGKPLLAVVGGPESAGEKTGLEEFFRSFNLAVNSSVVLDPVLNYRGQPAVLYAPVVGLYHPIVDSLANRAVLMPRASPTTILTAASEGQAGRTYNQAVLPAAILQTSEASWGETDLASKKLERNENELRGPLTVGAAVTDRPRPDSGQEPKPRLVLFSSRFMADNLFLVEEPTNLDLLMNAINWLRGQAELGGIAPKSHVALTLAADPVLRTRLVLVPTVMAVLLIIGLGLTTYMARRE